MENSNECITSENIDELLQEDVKRQYKSALREAVYKGADLALEEINGPEKAIMNS